jgi:hypothetical protein
MRARAVKFPDRFEPEFSAFQRLPRARSIGSSELGAPLSDRLVGHGHAPRGQEFLDVAQAKRESEVQSHGVGDDLGRVAMAAVQRATGGIGRHVSIVQTPPAQVEGAVC